MIESIRQIIVPILIVISGFLCLEFAIPISLGEFFAGIIGGAFFETTDIPWLDFFSQLGLLSIMFLAGFEIDIGVLKRNLANNISIGILSYFGPFLLIFVVAQLFRYSAEESFVLCISLSTTSLAIIFSILRQTGTLRSEHGQILLGSAMIVDILSALSLVILFIEFTWARLAYFGALLFALIMAKRTITSIFRRYQGNRFEFELKFLLLVLLAIELLADEAGIHSALIAFVLGMILSDIDPEHEEIISRLNSVVYSLLAPIFFFHTGMSIEFKEFGWNTVGMLLVFFAVAVGGKYVGTYSAFKLFFRQSKKLAQYAGLLFNYRLSFGIVAAIYSFDKGVIGVDLYNVILSVIALSSLFAIVAQKRTFSAAMPQPLPDKTQ